MAKECTDSSRFESRFGGGFITGPQFLAESMIARLARKDKVELPHKFWNLPRWKQPFLYQLRLANSLLKLYSVKAIVRALRSPRGKNIYSFSAPWLDELIRAEQEKLNLQIENLKEKEKDREKEVTPPQDTSELRPAFVFNRSSLNKLKDLDG